MFDKALAAFTGLPVWKKVLIGLASALVIGGGALKGVQAMESEGAKPASEGAATKRRTATPENRDAHPKAADSGSTSRSLAEKRRRGAETSLTADAQQKPSFLPGPGSDSGSTERTGSGGEVARLPWPGGPDSETGDPRAPAEGADGTGSSLWSPAMLKGGFSFFVAFCIGLTMRLFVRLSFIYIGLVGLTLLGLSWLGWVEVHWDVPERQFSSLAANVQAQFESFRSFLQGSLPSAGMAGLGLISGLKKK